MSDPGGNQRSEGESGARPGFLHALSRLRFEIAVIALLMLTIGAIIFANTILRETLVIGSGGVSPSATRWHTDESMHGDSTVAPRRPLAWSCILRLRYQYPYCSYEILFEQHADRGLDLSRFQTITLDLDYRGRGDSVRVYLKNRDPQYSVAGRADTAKYNQIELPVRNGHQRIEAKLSDFKVADWWIQKSRVPYRLSQTQFSNVVAFEIDTGSSAQPGRYDFDVRSITLRGNIVAIDQWYLGILGCWIILICLFLIARILDLQSDLTRRRLLHAAAQGEAQLAQEAARRDHLTGLHNRLGATELYRQMLANGGGKPAAIMLIDIDHFKSVNDRFGHAQGDAVLVAFAALLRSHTRDADLIARWGGEEFLLIARVSDAQAAMEMANKLRLLISATDFIRGGLTASFGVHVCPKLPTKLGPAISYADRALYKAKNEGRDRAVLHVPAEGDSGGQHKS